MVRIYAAPSGIEGTGCFAARSFSAGEVVGEYTGEIIDEAAMEARWARAEKVWFFDLGDGRAIDAERVSNPVKHMNHSCDPNCESVQDGDRVFVVALRAIAVGEEITYDYNLQVAEGEEGAYPCRCGALACRGTMVAQL